MTVDFIGIGFGKCGTTWLADCLAEHPEVYIPKKEMGYFNEFISTDREFAPEKIPNMTALKPIEWYEKFFSQAPEGTIKGEFTPSYVLCSQARDKIRYNYPSVKLVVMLREPVTRTRSKWLHRKREHPAYYSSFARTIRENPDFYDESSYAYYL